MNKQENNVDLELFEIILPGKVIGKAVIDSNARMVGVIRHINVNLPSGEIILIIKGLDSEFDLNISTIQAIGNVVQLNIPVKHAEPIDFKDIMRLRTEIREEILHFYEVQNEK